MIEAIGINKSFGRKKVLQGVKLHCHPGQVHALLGANGAGKSTLVHILAALMRPDSGVVSVFGEPLGSGDIEFRRKTGYVFEKPFYIDKFSAREYLEFVHAMYGLPPADKRSRVGELLDLF